MDKAEQQWRSVLAAGVKAQRLVRGAVAVGGTAAALYARHRFSNDTDHLVPGLRDGYDEVRESLERSPDWKTARVQPPVLILGSVDGVQVGFRQPRRTSPIATSIAHTEAGDLVIPTLDEMLGMKAYLAYSRNAARDYIDFAALSACMGDDDVLQTLLRSDARYGELQSNSAALEISKRLCDPKPFDLDSVDLRQYKGLAAEWQSWDKVAQTCRRHGHRLAETLILESDD